VLLLSSARADAPDEAARAARAARDKGLEYLTKHQAKDGSWGKQYTIAVTSFACLSYLAAADEPFTGDSGKALVKGLGFLLANQKDGSFSQQGHSWIHGQGFASLALSEAYGRSLLCKTKPDMDMKKVRAVVVQSVAVIAKNQSDSGGWWYTVGNKGDHEGSTTVCAVQALVSARSFGIKIDEQVLENGFAYLKKCQTKEGGFNYKLGDGTNMAEGGTAADVSTLGLMDRFDTTVMLNGYKFLLRTTPAVISNGRFPYYGHFYGCMGMQLLGQEFKDDKEYREKTQGYIAAVHKDVASWQQKDGSFPLKGWIKEGNAENQGYSTAFGTLVLGVTEARLSIYNRTPPKLPKDEETKPEDGPAGALDKAAALERYAFTVEEKPGKGGAAVEAKYQKGRPLYCKADGVEFYKKGDALVYKQDDQWKRTKRGVESDPLRILGASAKANSLKLPHEELAVLVKGLKEVKKADAKDDGNTVYTADLTEAALKQLTPSEFQGVATAGAVKVCVNGDGELVKYALTITLKGKRGNVEINGSTTKTVALTERGTAKVEPPEAAEKALN
jgi:hypothetical protein